MACRIEDNMNISNRKGEKIGWIGGWLGAFLWAVIMAVVFLAGGKPGAGGTGLVISLAGCLLVFLVTPWRFPRTRYWKLMLPLYLVMFLEVVWAISAFGGLKASGLNWWNLLILLPILSPMATMGYRRWEDRVGGNVEHGK